MRRHPPVMLDIAVISPEVRAKLTNLDMMCMRCGADPLDPIHWPPLGWREKLLEFLGMLR